MHPIERLRKEVGLTIGELAELAGLAETTIRRIESGSEFKTNLSVADSLADLFGCSIGDLFTAEELSHLGRPAHTGRSFSVTVTMTVVIASCPSCWLELPMTGVCSNCS